MVCTGVPRDMKIYSYNAKNSLIKKYDKCTVLCAVNDYGSLLKLYLL